MLTFSGLLWSSYQARHLGEPFFIRAFCPCAQSHFVSVLQLLQRVWLIVMLLFEARFAAPVITVSVVVTLAIPVAMAIVSSF